MNDYDTRCGWCDARYSTRWERAEHEKEEHGTVTDEQVNRIMSGQDKLWDTHDRTSDVPGFAGLEEYAEAERLGLGAVVRDLEVKHGRSAVLEDKPFGPGLNVTVPRTDAKHDNGDYRENRYEDCTICGSNVLQNHKLTCERHPQFTPPADAAQDITEADIVVEMQRQGLGLPPVALVTAGTICQQAADITAGDRQKQNGDKLPNHENIAALWSAYLSVPIGAHQAATMMVLLKVARTKLGAFNTDDYVDMAGYAGCAAEIRHRSNQEQN